ncbi:hypothetical protein [Paenibacillus sp. MBLB4367]|uniref:hypothetical protein n=1 Tax=Paenibacillus sp. MBLB4367 TaxID=3384767 RepID=UPI0039081DD9
MIEESNRTDLTINGMGNAFGGRYRTVNMEGVGKVDGDIFCESFKANGVATVKGSIQAARFEMNGKLSGEGNLTSLTLLVDGHMSLKGRLHGEEMRLNGMIKVNGDCEAERFNLQGGFTIDGLLNAGTIDIALYGRGQAKEIGGDSIHVKKSNHSSWGRLVSWILPVFEPHLFAETIEGDDIRLEETTAAVVRGNRVYIGPGCGIGRVEYGTELVVHPEAKVNERIRS